MAVGCPGVPGKQRCRSPAGLPEMSSEEERGRTLLLRSWSSRGWCCLLHRHQTFNCLGAKGKGNVPSHHRRHGQKSSPASAHLFEAEVGERVSAEPGCFHVNSTNLGFIAAESRRPSNVSSISAKQSDTRCIFRSDEQTALLGTKDTLQSKVSAEGPEAVAEKGKELAAGGSGRGSGPRVAVGRSQAPGACSRTVVHWVDAFVARGEPDCSSHVVGTAGGREGLQRSSLRQ